MMIKRLSSIVMSGVIALTSFVMTSCSDVETGQNSKEPTDGMSFIVSDVQDSPEASLPKTKAASVYEPQKIAITGEQGLCLLETTVEGVNPVQKKGADTRASLKTNIDSDFGIFACKSGSNTPDFMYNKKVSSAGKLYDHITWNKSDAASLKFYAVAPALGTTDATQRIQPAVYSNTTLPYVEFTANSDVKKQTDLMLATTDNMQYDNYGSSAIPLVFTHATTAIKFKIGNTLAYNREITKISIQGVYSKGQVDLRTKAWSNQNTPANYDLTLTPAVSTKQAKGATVTDGENTFLMVPQTLPAGAKIVITLDNGRQIIANIAGKVWAPGTTKTYEISNDNVADWDYTFTVEPASNAPYAYNATNAGFNVTSYRHLKDYNASSTGRTNVDRPVSWQISKKEYFDDATNSWVEGTPSMLVSIDNSGNGGTSAEAKSATLKNDYKNYKALREAELKAAPEVTTRKDLSIGANGQQTTANCYIVSAGGKYQFPLVYGNAIKNGTTNTAAFKPGNLSADANSYIKTFVGGSGDITSPNITGVASAEVTWCSEPGLVTLEGSGINGNNIEFNVDKTKMKEASAIITVKASASPGGLAIWSWHIWITSPDVVNTSTGYFMLEPLGFRHTQWEGTTYQKDRKMRLTFKQAESGKTSTIEITQKALPLVNKGESMFYQQGRKDPLWWQSPFTVQSYGENKGFTLQQAAQYNTRMAESRRTSGHATTKGNWDWNWNPDADHTYFNLWDAKNTVGYGYTGTFIKTVYDPSPAGFHVPRASDFTKIKNGNNNKPATVPTIGRLNPDYLSSGIVDFDKGYFWSSEKCTGTGTYYGYYGVLAQSTANADGSISFGAFESGASTPIFSNSSFGYSVISIKE